MSKLHYVPIDTSNPGENTELCEKAFKLWKNVWTETFQKLGVHKDQVNSDDFLNKKMVTLTYDNDPIALFFSNTFDIGRNSNLAHSYFNNYPKNVVEFLTANISGEVLALSYMTIDKHWRFKAKNLPIPDILFSLSVYELLESQTENIIGYIRTDKSFFKSFYRHGAAKIASKEAYNVSVDFCYLNRKDAVISDNINLVSGINNNNKEREAA